MWTSALLITLNTTTHNSLCLNYSSEAAATWRSSVWTMAQMEITAEPCGNDMNLSCDLVYVSPRLSFCLVGPPFVVLCSNVIVYKTLARWRSSAHFRAPSSGFSSHWAKMAAKSQNLPVWGWLMFAGRRWLLQTLHIDIGRRRLPLSCSFCRSFRSFQMIVGDVETVQIKYFIPASLQQAQTDF